MTIFYDPVFCYLNPFFAAVGLLGWGYVQVFLLSMLAFSLFRFEVAHMCQLAVHVGTIVLLDVQGPFLLVYVHFQCV